MPESVSYSVYCLEIFANLGAIIAVLFCSVLFCSVLSVFCHGHSVNPSLALFNAAHFCGYFYVDILTQFRLIFNVFLNET